MSWYLVIYVCKASILFFADINFNHTNAFLSKFNTHESSISY